MSKKHVYSSDRNKNVLIWIAILSVISAIILQKALSYISKVGSFETIFSEYSWLFSPLTLSGFYGLYYWIFNNYLWYRRPNCSNLNGTWLGVTMSSSQTWPHYSVMKIEQDWSEVSITITVFYIDFPEDDWATKGKILGIDTSVGVHLTDQVNSESDLTINYSHEGYRQPTIIDGQIIRHSQPDFPGTICLKAFLGKKNCILSGYLYTNKFSVAQQKWGTNGKLRFIKTKTDNNDPVEIFNEALVNGSYKRIEKEVINL